MEQDGAGDDSGDFFTGWKTDRSLDLTNIIASGRRRSSAKTNFFHDEDAKRRKDEEKAKKRKQQQAKKKKEKMPAATTAAASTAAACVMVPPAVPPRLPPPPPPPRKKQEMLKEEDDDDDVPLLQQLTAVARSGVGFKRKRVVVKSGPPEFSTKAPNANLSSTPSVQPRAPYSPNKPLSPPLLMSPPPPRPPSQSPSLMSPPPRQSGATDRDAGALLKPKPVRARTPEQKAVSRIRIGDFVVLKGGPALAKAFLSKEEEFWIGAGRPTDHGWLGRRRKAASESADRVAMPVGRVCALLNRNGRPMVRIVRILDEEETLEGRLGGPAADLRKCMGQTAIGGMERRAFLALRMLRRGEHVMSLSTATVPLDMVEPADVRLQSSTITCILAAGPANGDKGYTKRKKSRAKTVTWMLSWCYVPEVDVYLPLDGLEWPYPYTSIDVPGAGLDPRLADLGGPPIGRIVPWVPLWERRAVCHMCRTATPNAQGIVCSCEGCGEYWCDICAVLPEPHTQHTERWLAPCCQGTCTCLRCALALSGRVNQALQRRESFTQGLDDGPSIYTSCEGCCEMGGGERDVGDVVRCGSRGCVRWMHLECWAFEQESFREEHRQKDAIGRLGRRLEMRFRGESGRRMVRVEAYRPTEAGGFFLIRREDDGTLKWTSLKPKSSRPRSTTPSLVSHAETKSPDPGTSSPPQPCTPTNPTAPPISLLPMPPSNAPLSPPPSLSSSSSLTSHDNTNSSQSEDDDGWYCALCASQTPSLDSTRAAAPRSPAPPPPPYLAHTNTNSTDEGAHMNTHISTISGSSIVNGARRRREPVWGGRTWKLLGDDQGQMSWGIVPGNSTKGSEEISDVVKQEQGCSADPAAGQLLGHLLGTLDVGGPRPFALPGSYLETAQWEGAFGITGSGGDGGGGVGGDNEWSDEGVVKMDIDEQGSASKKRDTSTPTLYGALETCTEVGRAQRMATGPLPSGTVSLWSCGADLAEGEPAIGDWGEGDDGLSEEEDEDIPATPRHDDDWSSCARTVPYRPVSYLTSAPTSHKKAACTARRRAATASPTPVHTITPSASLQSPGILSPRHETGGACTDQRAQRADHRRLKKALGLDLLANSDLFRIDEFKSRQKALRFGKSRIHRWGVFAMEPIAKGEVVLEYRGELITNAVADKREREQNVDDYMFRIDADVICDATRRGSLARYINHSCEPNCYTSIIPSDGRKKIFLYAKRDIRPGEELSYDYKFPLEENKIPCLCGAQRCRRFMN